MKLGNLVELGPHGAPVLLALFRAQDDNGWATYGTLADHLGVRDGRALYRPLQALAAQGLVERSSPTAGEWGLTEAGGVLVEELTAEALLDA